MNWPQAIIWCRSEYDARSLVDFCYDHGHGWGDHSSDRPTRFSNVNGQGTFYCFSSDGYLLWCSDKEFFEEKVLIEKPSIDHQYLLPSDPSLIFCDPHYFMDYVRAGGSMEDEITIDESKLSFIL